MLLYTSAIGGIGYYLGINSNSKKQPLDNSSQKLSYFNAEASKITSNISKQNNLTCVPHHIAKDRFPPNSLEALQMVTKDGFDLSNATLTLTSDNQIIVAHQADLLANSQIKDDHELYRASELKKTDPVYFLQPQNNYPYRGKGIKIPTLKQLLTALPSQSSLVLDLKSRRNDILVKNLVDVINQMPNSQNYWEKLMFYSTDNKAIAYLQELAPKAILFLNRKDTLEILLCAKFNKEIPQELKDKISQSQAIGFENTKKLSLCENFTLGKNCVDMEIDNLWNPEIIKTLKQLNPNIKIFMFAADSKKDQIQAERLKTKIYLYLNDPYSYEKCFHNSNRPRF